MCAQNCNAPCIAINDDGLLTKTTTTTTTMQTDVRLNERLSVHVALTWRMLKASDASVLPEKRALYQLARRAEVPLLEARFSALPAPLTALAERGVQLRLVAPADVAILVDWLLDARGPNEYDDMRRYLLQHPKERRSRKNACGLYCTNPARWETPQSIKLTAKNPTVAAVRQAIHRFITAINEDKESMAFLLDEQVSYTVGGQQRTVTIREALTGEGPELMHKALWLNEKTGRPGGALYKAIWQAYRDESGADEEDPDNVESFVYARLGAPPCFESKRDLVLQWTPQWDRLRSREAVAALVGSAMRHLEIEAVHWAPYMLHTLYSQPESLLYKASELQRRYDIVPVGIERQAGGRDKAYWVALLTRYRHENPDGDYSESVLYDRPHDYEVLSPRTLSFVALDRQRENRMAGYVTCTLRAIHSHAPEDAAPFKLRELNLFSAHLRDRNAHRDDAGYDVYSVDGVHVHNDNRGEPGATPLSKVLVFYALEFIRVAHRALGVSLVMAGAEAAPTKAILAGTFGFAHFNLAKDLQWLQRRLQDFWLVRGHRAAGVVQSDTPLALLTRARLAAAVEGVREKVLVDDGTTKRYKYELVKEGAQQALAAFLDETARLLRESLKRDKSEDPDIGAKRTVEDNAWPADSGFWSTREFKTQLVDRLAEYRQAMDTDEELGQAYMTRVNTLLGTGIDNQDCFLWIGDQNNAFDGKMLAFYDLYNNKHSAVDADSNSSNWVDEHDVAFVTRREHQDDTSVDQVPTERDAQLYALWLKLEADGDVINASMGSVDATLRRIDQEYLDAQRHYERDEVRPRVEAQARPFFDLMRPNSPPDWSDERVMALARDSARLHLEETGGLSLAFMGRRAWVAQHYPRWAHYYR
jgi:hypothetical protein